MAGQMIEYPSNGSTAKGYLTGGGPGVVVIQEWWGLNDQIKGVADMLAGEGFTALAPDFYHGSLAGLNEPDEAGKLMMALDIDRAAKDARGAATELAKRSGGKVGVVGFCMGGQLALLTGTVAPDQVGAVVDCYGGHPAVKPDYAALKAPVLGIFAGHDDHVNEEVRTQLAKTLSNAGAEHSFHVYPDAEHGFLNDQRPDAYRPDDARDAWSKIIGFYREHLS
ncbi:MAG: dienelactone hydrolase family protein [Actinomycetota bacterium]